MAVAKPFIFEDFLDVRGRARTNANKRVAGAPGFEPGITGPKPVALPLGHAPIASEICPASHAFARCGRALSQYGERTTSYQHRAPRATHG